MRFTKSRINDWCLLDTPVENIFINEYMSTAPGDYVKVYLYAQMCAGLELEISNRKMAQQMNISEEVVQNAWEYWEQNGIIKRHREDETVDGEFAIEFISIKEAMYSNYGTKSSQVPSKAKSQSEGLDSNHDRPEIPTKHNKSMVMNPDKSTQMTMGAAMRNAVPSVDEVQEETPDSNILIDENLKNLCQAVSHILGRPLLQQEHQAINSWLVDYQITPEVIIYGYTYCKSRNKDNYKYVGTILRQWASEGLTTSEDVEEFLDQADERHYCYKRIFKSLGFMRNPTEKEQKIMDSWFDELNYTLERILEACSKTSGIANPNINYINKVLQNWNKSNGGSKPGSAGKPEGQAITVGQVMQYYDHIRRVSEVEAEMHRDEIYAKIPEIAELDKEARDLSMKASKMMLSRSSDKEQVLEKLKADSDNITMEKAWLLTENSFPPDYMEIKYKCEICKDTGITDDGGRCKCFPDRMKEAEEWQRTKRNKKEN